MDFLRVTLPRESAPRSASGSKPPSLHSGKEWDAQVDEEAVPEWAGRAEALRPEEWADPEVPAGEAVQVEWAVVPPAG